VTFPSRTLLWLKEGWQAEFVSDLGPSYVLHVHSTKKASGALVHRVVRILDERHIAWLVERDLNTPGDYEGRGLRPKRDAKGRVIKRMGDWLQPFHEAVKRLAPRHESHPTIRFYWLTAYLRWRHLPCICNHEDIVAHLATEASVDRKVVEMSIERATREAARTIGNRVPDNPMAVEVPSGRSLRTLRSRSVLATPGAHRPEVEGRNRGLGEHSVRLRQLPRGQDESGPEGQTGAGSDRGAKGHAVPALQGTLG
jgi:hypothetical protein